MAQHTTEIVVPGSTSNLGPGFDALAVAVDLFLRVEVLDVLPSEPDRFETTFVGAAPARENRIATAFQAGRERAKVDPAGVRVRVHSDIPIAAGLGSSAAASLAGIRLYELAAGITFETSDVLALAAQLDGHPDNAAAALLGGITLSCEREDGEVIARSWLWPADIRFIVATPEFTLHTKKARAVLPEVLPLRDAVANLQRALLLVRALETGQYDDLREALRDRWHQPARSPLVPGLPQALAIDHPSVLGVCLSGAGPSVVALAAPGRSQEASLVLGSIYQRLGMPHTIRNLAAHGSAMSRLPGSLTEREKTA